MINFNILKLLATDKYIIARIVNNVNTKQILTLEDQLTSIDKIDQSMYILVNKSLATEIRNYIEANYKVSVPTHIIVLESKDDIIIEKQTKIDKVKTKFMIAVFYYWLSTISMKKIFDLFSAYTTLLNIVLAYPHILYFKNNNNKNDLTTIFDDILNTFPNVEIVTEELLKIPENLVTEFTKSLITIREFNNELDNLNKYMMDIQQSETLDNILETYTGIIVKLQNEDTTTTG